MAAMELLGDPESYISVLENHESEFISCESFSLFRISNFTDNEEKREREQKYKLKIIF